jgi:hypothetical protein
LQQRSGAASGEASVSMSAIASLCELGVRLLKSLAQHQSGPDTGSKQRTPDLLSPPGANGHSGARDGG